ncbi:MAG: hypothetical protein AB9919_06745 [Geobacteraceae bacterium]
MGNKLRVVEICHDNQSYFDCCIAEALEALADEAEIGNLPEGDYVVRFHEMTEEEYEGLAFDSVDWLPVYTVVQNT